MNYDRTLREFGEPHPREGNYVRASALLTSGNRPLLSCCAACWRVLSYCIFCAVFAQPAAAALLASLQPLIT